MIENLKIKRDELFEVWSFLKHNVHPDFYLTENDSRVLITEYSYFKRLIKQSHFIFVSKELNEVNGIIMLWKGLGGGKKRSYVKINAVDGNITRKLITVLLWHSNKNLHLKMGKYSPYLRLFREKNFSFVGGRGRELLLVFKNHKRIS